MNDVTDHVLRRSIKGPAALSLPSDTLVRVEKVKGAWAQVVSLQGQRGWFQHNISDQKLLLEPDSDDACKVLP